jgi:hypothetical protein
MLVFVCFSKTYVPYRDSYISSTDKKKTLVLVHVNLIFQIQNDSWLSIRLVSSAGPLSYLPFSAAHMGLHRKTSTPCIVANLLYNTEWNYIKLE